MKDNNYPWYEYVTASEMFTTLISGLRNEGFWFKVNSEILECLYEYILECVHKDEDVMASEVFDRYLGSPCVSNTVYVERFYQVIHHVNKLDRLNPATCNHTECCPSIRVGDMLSVPRGKDPMVSCHLIDGDFPTVSLKRDQI